MTYDIELVKMSKLRSDVYRCKDTKGISHESTKDQLNVDTKFLIRADKNVVIDLQPLVRLHYGHFDGMTFIWGGPDSRKAGEILEAKWGMSHGVFEVMSFTNRVILPTGKS